MKKLVKIYFREGTTIDVLFNDGIIKRYDVLCLANLYPELNQLRDRNLFLKGRILGTSGIIWNDELDLDGDTIYSDGKSITIDEPTEMILLGFRIKEERLKKGISQQELSLLTGIDQGDISKIENGYGNPTVSTIAKICSSLKKRFKCSLV